MDHRCVSITRYRLKIVRTFEGIAVRQPSGVGKRMSEMTCLTINVSQCRIMSNVEISDFARSRVMIMYRAHVLTRVGSSGHAELKRQHDEQEQENESSHVS